MLGKGKYFCSHSTSSLPSFIKDNRWWKIISLFPGPTQEILIYFLLHVGNTKVKSYYSGWIPTKSPPCSSSVRTWSFIRPQTTAQSRHSCDHHSHSSWLRQFNLLVLMNISSFCTHTFCTSGGIRCICLCHTHTFLVIFPAVILLEMFVPSSADFLQNSLWSLLWRLCLCNVLGVKWAIRAALEIKVCWEIVWR